MLIPEHKVVKQRTQIISFFLTSAFYAALVLSLNVTSTLQSDAADTSSVRAEYLQHWGNGGLFLIQMLSTNG